MSELRIDWYEEVLKRKHDLISDTQRLLKIKSVLDETSHGEGLAPFGKGIAEAMDFLLMKGKEAGFISKNLDGFAGHIEMGDGEEIVGILCHVDVVPEGDNWASDPFGAEIRDGNIYARGAIDDKGPTMAAFYAMKIVKELGLPLTKKVRMIIGTDEESDWRCVEHYFQHEEMPVMGFAPDADFPIIYAEKGIADFDLVQQSTGEHSHSEGTLLSLKAGRRYNMVPDFAEAILSKKAGMKTDFSNFLKESGLEGHITESEEGITLQLIGLSAHGMEPDNGINAGLMMINFLSTFDLGDQANRFVKFVQSYFVEDSRGRKLAIAEADDMTGDLTINVGKLTYTDIEGGQLGLNMRYPVTAQLPKTMDKIKMTVKSDGFNVTNIKNSNPHHVDQNHPLIVTLQRVYEEQTGNEPTLLSIGGATYARSLTAGVAFGPVFPGRVDVAHQKDEYIVIDDLLKATAIYAQAIYELAK